MRSLWLLPYPTDLEFEPKSRLTLRPLPGRHCQPTSPPGRGKPCNQACCSGRDLQPDTVLPLPTPPVPALEIRLFARFSLLEHPREVFFHPMADNVTPTSGLGQGPHFVDVGLTVGLVHLHHDEMLVGHGLWAALVRWRGCRVGWGRRRGWGRGALKPTSCRAFWGWALQPRWGLDPGEGTDGVLADQGELGIHLPPGAVQGRGNGSIDSARGRLLSGCGSSGGHADRVLLGVARRGTGVSGGHEEKA